MIVLANGYLLLRYDRATDVVLVTELSPTPEGPTVRSAIPMVDFLADLSGDETDEDLIS